MGKIPLVVFCTNAVTVFVLVWMSDANGASGKQLKREPCVIMKPNI